MIKHSLNEIVSDIMQIYFNSKPSDESQLSRMEVAAWIHQYRAMLIKQDIDKGYDINESYVQWLPGLRLIPADYGEDAKLVTGRHRLRTEKKIPKPIDLHYGDSFMVYTMNDDEIQIMPESRASWQRFRKFTAEAPRCYYTNDYIYVEGCDLLEYVKVKGIFEDPQELAAFSGECFDADGPYPMPINMIPILRQMILQRELGIMQLQPSDITNDSNDERTQTVIGGQSTPQGRPAGNQA